MIDTACRISEEIDGNHLDIGGNQPGKRGEGKAGRRGPRVARWHRGFLSLGFPALYLSAMSPCKRSLAPFAYPFGFGISRIGSWTLVLGTDCDGGG